MSKRVSYDFEDVDGSYVETNRSVRYRIGNRFHLGDITDIRILEKGTEKLGELDGVEYYIASPVTFAVRGRVYYTLGDTLFYMPELESTYLGGDGR